MSISPTSHLSISNTRCRKFGSRFGYYVGWEITGNASRDCYVKIIHYIFSISVAFTCVERIFVSSPVDKILFNTVWLCVHTILSI